MPTGLTAGVSANGIHFECCSFGPIDSGCKLLIRKFDAGLEGNYLQAFTNRFCFETVCVKEYRVDM